MSIQGNAMKKVLLIAQFCIIQILFSNNLFAGFAAGTQVKVCGGYKSIEQIKVGDCVHAMSEGDGGGFHLSYVTDVTSYFLPQAVLFAIGNEFVICAPKQKLFHAPEWAWKEARDMQGLVYTLGCMHNARPVMDFIGLLEEEYEFFDIRLESGHVFCVTRNDIIVHNFPPFFIGVAFTFGEWKLAFDSFYGGICIFGWWLGSHLLKHGSERNRWRGSSGDGNRSDDDGKIEVKPFCTYSGSPGPGRGPDDDEDDRCEKKESKQKVSEEKIDGLYRASEKHHPNVKGRISPGLGPVEGQEAVNDSYPIKDSTARVAVRGKEFVMLPLTGRDPSTGKNVYHSYLVERWHDLSDGAKKALYKNGIRINYQTGKWRKT